MTQEDKDLLLKDLCARLPYGVKLKCASYKIICISPYKLDTIVLDRIFNENTEYVPFDEFKPYLFPLSSMTEEQKRDLTSLFKCCIIIKQHEIDFPNYEDNNMDNWMKVCTWCYKNHFDIYGLIPKDLAIDATGLNIY